MTERILAGRYRVEETLGEGGTSSVWRGVDVVLDRNVAIKVLRSRGDERFVARFRREAQAAAALNHPNIVSVYDTGSDNGVQYIVMELVEGETLADVLRREGPLPPQRAVAMGAAIARALHAAHGAGLVHRDVKPGNVMVTPTGEVKVMDFGIARGAADDTLTQTGTVIGTAAYLAPEQARGDKADPRTDVYALGCVLFEMVTGRPPFIGGSALELAYQHVNEDPSPPSELAPVPADLEAAIMRALDKDPDRRFPSAKAMLNALSGTEAGRDTEPSPPPTDVLPTAPVAPLRPRRRWLLVATLAALGAAAAGLIVLTAEEERAAPGGPRPRGGAGTKQVQPTPSPLTVEGAFSALDELVAAGASAGGISEEVAQKLAERSGEAAAKYVAGDAVGALQGLAEAQNDLDEAAAEGEVTAPWVERVGQAIALTAETIEAFPPPSPVETPPAEEEGDEDEGPGNSEFAPGHNKNRGKSGKD